MERYNMRQEEQLVLDVAQRLRRIGASAQDVERTACVLARAVGVSLDVHVLPSTLFVADLRTGEPRTWMLAAEPCEEDLGAREELAAIVDAARAGAPVADLRDRIAALDRASGPGPAALALASAAVCGSAGALLGGGGAEVGASALIGAGVDAISGRFARLDRFAPARPLAGVGVAAFATVAAQGWPWAVAPEVVVLASLVSRMPGFALTTALSELATGHRVTGGAGMLAATFTLLELGAGAALGAELARRLGVAATAPVQALPAWGVPAAILVFVLAVAPLLRIRPRHLGWVAAGAFVAVAGELFGARWVGPQLAGGVGAFAATLVARAFSGRTGLSPVVVQVPALLVLVPGTVGFRAVQALLAADVEAGVETLFSMALGATSLVFGALGAEALADLPARSDRAPTGGRFGAA